MLDTHNVGYTQCWTQAIGAPDLEARSDRSSTEMRDLRPTWLNFNRGIQSRSDCVKVVAHMKTNFPNRSRFFVASAAFALVVVGSIAVWSFVSVDHVASGSQTHQFVIDCDFDKFRQIMVRKNASAAIIGKSGMTLVDQEIEEVQLDTSQDDRPVRNAIRGKSKSEVLAIKHLVVQVNDPALQGQQLALRQRAEVKPDLLDVSTRSKSAAGNLKNYQTTLQARPRGDQTEVKLTVALQVQVRVPKIFTGRADTRVQQAADNAVTDQAKSIESFIGEYSDNRIILPELRR